MAAVRERARTRKHVLPSCMRVHVYNRARLSAYFSLALSISSLPSFSLSLSFFWKPKASNARERETLEDRCIYIYTHARVYNRYIARACVSAKEASFSQDFSLLLLLPREREREDCEVGLGGEHLSPHLSRSAIIKFLQIVAHTRSGQGKYISSREENEFRIVCVHAWNIVYTGACHTW